MEKELKTETLLVKNQIKRAKRIQFSLFVLTHSNTRKWKSVSLKNSYRKLYISMSGNIQFKTETLFPEILFYIVLTELKRRKPMMILPYVADIGCILIKSLKKNLQRALPVNIQTCLVHTGTKLSSQLRNIKIPHHLKSNVIIYITPFVVLKTVMRITSVKVHHG